MRETEMTKSGVVGPEANSFISNATVSGNLHDCRPLFIDEYGILLCASGYVQLVYCIIAISDLRLIPNEKRLISNLDILQVPDSCHLLEDWRAHW